NHTGAIEYYDKALAIDPHNVNALYNIGIALDNLRNHTGAIEYYDKALAIDPHNVNALINKGISLYDLDKYHDAIVLYNKALALNPNDVDAIHNKANALGKIACIIGNTTACYSVGINVQKPPQPSQPDLLVSFGKALFQ
ncbi:MAG: tetratricopeptide repeat protein, partial [Candidatus Nitrosopolaris sp.]